MKKTLGILVAFAAIAGFIASCKKDKTNEELNKQNATPITYVTDFNYELFGIAHNGFLKSVYEPYAGGDYTTEQIYNIGQSYTDPVFGSFSINIPYNEFAPSVDVVSGWADKVVDETFVASSLIESNYFKADMEVFLNEIAAIFQNAGNNRMNPTEFSIEIEKLNAWVRTNHTPTITDDFIGNTGAKMLAMASIAKHSYAYWYEYLEVGRSNAQEKNIFTKAWRAVKIAAADSYGFFDWGIQTDENGTPTGFSLVDATFGASMYSGAVANR